MKWVATANNVTLHLLLIQTVSLMSAIGCGNSAEREIVPSTAPSPKARGIIRNHVIEVVGGVEKQLGMFDTATELVAAAQLRNVSSETVVLDERVRTSSGCSKARLDRTMLRPREQATLSVTISLSEDDEVAKRVSATVYVDKPTSVPPVMCFFTAQVRAEWKVRPESLHVAAKPDEEREVAFEVAGYIDHPVSLESVTSNLPRFHAAFPSEVIAPNKPVTVKAVFRCPKEPGWHDFIVLFKVRNGGTKERSVPVRVNVVLGWQVMPKALLFQAKSALEAEVLRRRCVLVGDRQADDFVLEQDGLEGLRVVLTDGKELGRLRWRYEFEVSLDVKKVEKPFQTGKITIGVVNGKETTRIPISVVCVRDGQDR